MADPVFDAVTECLAAIEDLQQTDRIRVARTLTAVVDLTHDPRQILVRDAIVGGNPVEGVGVVELGPPPRRKPGRPRKTTEPIPAPLTTIARSPKAPSSHVKWRPSDRKRATEILSLLRTSKEGMGASMLAKAMGTAAQNLAPALRGLLQEGRVRTTGVYGSKSSRYHLASPS